MPSLFNYVLCKVFPHEFGLLNRKFSPTGLDGLPSTIECGKHDANGVRVKYAAVYLIVEKLEHLSLPLWARAYIARSLEGSECFAFQKETTSPMETCPALPPHGRPAVRFSD